MSLASLGIDYGVLNAMNLWVACFQPADDGHLQRVDFVFHEERPDLAEIKLVSREPSDRVGRGATGIMLPWCNFDRMESLGQWHTWFEGKDLCALAGPGEPVMRVALEAPPAFVVSPPLASRAGEMDVLLVTAGQRELVLVRFQPASGGRAASGAIAWRFPLPGPVVSGCAALGPAAAGSARKAVLAAQENDAVALHLVDFSGGARPGGLVTVRLEGMSVVPGSVPGLRVDETGAAQAALVVASAVKGSELQIADAVFPVVEATRPRVSVTLARTVDAAPCAAGIAYQARPDRPMRRDWAVVLADGSVASSQSGQTPMRPEGKPVTPLNLVALSQATYLLTVGLEGPTLEALH